VTNEELIQAVEAAATNYPRAAKTCTEVLRLSPALLRPQLIYLLEHHAAEFWKRAEWLVGLCEGLDGNPAEALMEYTLAYLKEQVQFLQNDEYSHTDFDDVYKEVYGNPEVMEKFYLPGLLLTHAFWPIHFDMHDFFQREFVARVADRGIGAEYGFGHGLYLLEMLSQRPQTKVKGFDISPYSHAYAGKLLDHAGISKTRYSLDIADVRQPLACPAQIYEWTIFAEIIEHIPDPLFSLGELRRTMTTGGHLFATTVVNSNAIDHLYLFRDVSEVDQLMQAAGYDIVAKQVFRVADYGASKTKDPSIDVAYVCVPRR